VYQSSDVQRELGLSREDLVAFAYFLGSDYTEGVNGVGIVNAVEILQAFPMRNEAGGPVAGLRRFKAWLEGFDAVQAVHAKFNEVETGKRKRNDIGEIDDKEEEGEESLQEAQVAMDDEVKLVRRGAVEYAA
jgi:DNA excision repair protein ERCC-5